MNNLNYTNRLFHLFPRFAKENIEYLKELDRSETALSVLERFNDEKLGDLINIRELSIKFKLETLQKHCFKLLSNTFALKNLNLKRITFENASSEILEFVRLKDAVRRTHDLKEFQKRLQGNFRCYGMFHDRFEYPVAFVYIRLYRGLAETLPKLLDETENTEHLDSCIFYTISAPIIGLTGIKFGGNLIKSVVQVIKTERPEIKIFATFSPIPHFTHWLSLHHPHLHRLPAPKIKENEIELVKACGEYLGGGTSDPVAKFHYKNGAILGPIRFEADMTNDSIKNSYGIQVNYIYYK